MSIISPQSKGRATYAGYAYLPCANVMALPSISYAPDTCSCVLDVEEDASVLETETGTFSNR